jgi:hypothetical protein
MNNAIKIQQPLTRRNGSAKRCYQCGGRFGLVRRRLGMKQFCSKKCLNQYNTQIERTTTRIQEWTNFLA